MDSAAAGAGKILPAGFVYCRERFMAAKTDSPQSQFTDFQWPIGALGSGMANTPPISLSACIPRYQTKPVVKELIDIAS